MSLLRKPELNTRWKKLLLAAVSLLLLVPCVAAATYAMRFDVQTNTQEPAAQEKIMDPHVRDERERKERVETEMREVRQAALVRLAKINMDQAIQIATSQQPGKVLFCSLEATHWKEPGVLAEDGYVFYRVIIANDNEGATHIWVNAADSSIIKTEKELPRKRQP